MKKIDLMIVRKIGRMKARAVAFSLVLAVASSLFMTGLYTAEVLSYSTDTFITSSKMPDVFIEFSGSVNITDVEKAMRDAGISTFQPRLKLYGTYLNRGEVYPLIIIGVEDVAQQQININKLNTGRYSDCTSFTPQTLPAALNTLPIEANAVSGSEKIGADADKQIGILLAGKNYTVNITGTVRAPEFAMMGYMAEPSVPLPLDIVVLFVDIDCLRLMADVPSEMINDLVLLLEGADRTAVESAISNNGLPVKSILYQKDHPTVVMMGMGVDKMRYMMPLFSVIFLIIGFISIMMTSYRLIAADTHYIGVLMSLGYTRTRICRAYLVFGYFLTVLGYSGGIGLTFLFTYYIAKTMMDLWASFSLVFPFAPMPFLYGLLFSAVAVMFAVIFPVITVTRSTVREALDSKPKTKVFAAKSKHPLMQKLPALSRVTLMGIRNTVRNPPRFVLTVFVIGLTIGASGSWLIMTDSVISFFEKNRAAEQWDLRADFIMPQPESNATIIIEYISNNMQQWSGEGCFTLEASVPFIAGAGSVLYNGQTESAIIIGSDKIREVKSFGVMEGEVDFYKGVVVTAELAKDMGISAGDTITYGIGNASSTSRVAGVVSELFVKAVYTSEQEMEKITGRNYTGIYLRFGYTRINIEDIDDNSFRDTKEFKVFLDNISSSARRHPLVSRVTEKEKVEDSMANLLNQALKSLWVFFIITVSIAAIVSGSLVIISAMEREMEFATLDVLGISRWNIAKSILVEMTVLGLASSLTGIPLAFLFGKIFAIIMEKILFYYPLIFAFGAVIITFLSGFGFVLISSAAPVRYSFRINTEKVIRERAGS
ncbi:MAG: FtsX-like permease family protein [Thermoplasmata archaeon]